MNRNVESHFAELPSANIERSMFDRSFGHKTAFDTGELIPFFVDEVLPGDTFNVTTSAVVRLQTLINPIMSNMYMDTYYFFVPSRLCWTHWKEFMGENTQSAWIPQTEYAIPYVNYPANGWQVGTIADYMGIPVGVQGQLASECPMALPFRAYALICNEWFRDQNVSDPLNIPLGDANQNGSNGDNYITDVANGGKPFKVAKYHDYFTSALPSPQKSAAISVFGSKIEPSNGVPGDIHQVPVYAGSGENAFANWTQYGLKGRSLNSDGTQVSNSVYYLQRTSGSKNANIQTFGTSDWTYSPTNLYADMTLFDLSINELRLAFQLQKFYEKQARAGSRYRETILEMFGVHSPDARMMIPEYLGGHRFPLTIHQVANTSQGENDFLGDLGAMSNTSDIHEDFVKSFTEHGYVIGVCCVRYDHEYSQGLERMWTRRNMTDWYWPVFANIGEQPIYRKEIYLDDTAAGDSVFGYQEAWADYRFKPSRTSSEMRPGVSNSLANWHLGDYYASTPYLSDSWIREDKAPVDRALRVTSSAAKQIFCDFYVKNISTRPMPMYSVPGLIDHH